MRLGTRLLLPLLATVAAVMTLYTAWALVQRQTTLGAQARRETQVYATALGLAIENAFRDGKLQDVQEIINRIGREPKIYAVLVYGPDGRLLFVSELVQTPVPAPAPLLGEVLATGQPADFEREIESQQVYSVLRPILESSGGVVGAFEVAQPLSFVEAEKASTRNRFFLNTATLIAAVTAVFLWLVRRLVTAPLLRLVIAVRALGRGELGHRIGEDAGAAELAVLAREFNRMADGIESAHAELVREAEERVALERRLRETEKLAAVGNLAAGLAHEIAAPLNVIAGRAEMLRRRETEPEARERNLRIIVEQIGRITRSVHQLLGFARRGESRVRPLDAWVVIDGVAEFLEGEFARAGVRLETAGPRPAWIYGDPHLLHQVFLNLAMNAIQALEAQPDEGRVALRVAGAAGRPGGSVTVEIEDNGPGIPDDLRGRIFEPFFTTKSSGEGTGLGLAVVRSIVEEHGGRIEAAASPGGGALFRLHLPAAPVPEPAHA